MKKEKIILALLGLVTILGFFMRISGINYGVPSKNLALTTYHPDEPLLFYTIEKWEPKRLYFHPGRAMFWGGFHLFPTAALLKVAQLLGYVEIGNRQFLVEDLTRADRLYHVARLLQIINGTLSIILTFLILCFFTKPFYALLGAAFFAFVPVHIVNSFSTRPDVTMIFFTLLSLYTALRYDAFPSTKIIVFCGSALGLGMGSKYNGAIYGIVPFLILCRRRNWKDLLIFCTSTAVVFLLSCPYTLIDFEHFYQSIITNLKMTQSAIGPVFDGMGWINYIVYYLPAGMGWPLVAAGLLGWIFSAIFLFYQIVVKKKVNHLEWIFLISSIVIFFITSKTKSQTTWYTLPVIPWIIIYSIRFFESLQNINRFAKIISACLIVLIFGYTTIYSFASLSLYTTKNVREAASEWISHHIPKGDSILIIRSYFWTPAILRQYHPPYRVIEGVDAQSFIGDGILNLTSQAEDANWWVLTELEYAPYLYPLYNSQQSKESISLRNFMKSGLFEEVKVFDKEAQWLGISFLKTEFTPHDWFYSNPKIHIYKRVKNKL